MEDSIWFVPLMIAGGIAFVAFMLFVFVKRMGGWHGLQKAYPLPEGKVVDGEYFSMQTLRIQFLIDYRNMVAVIVTQDGLALKASALMSWLLPPIFIPWNEISSMEKKSGFRSSMVFKTKDKRFTIAGSSVQAIANFK